MIGIKGIAYHFPENRIDNIAQAESFEHDESFVRKRLGPVKLYVTDAQDEASDLALSAFRKLCEEYSLDPEVVDAVVMVTQNPDGTGLPHASAKFHAKAGLRNKVAVFDVSLGCSGYVYGLSILKGMMAECGMKVGVLLTADPYSKVIDRSDRVTSLLFSDAATATLLTDDPVIKINKPRLCTNGKGWDALYVDKKTEKLKMNGRAVFDFARLEVPKNISQYMSDNGLDISEIDKVYLHQGSQAIIDAIKRQFSGYEDKFHNNIEEIGNTVSSSIPIALKDHFLQDSAQSALLCGFGVGLSIGTVLIEKIKES